jgi:hypothetical protein
MTQPEDDTAPSQADRLRGWLKSDVTVTLPGWAYALGGVVVLTLLLVALE